MKNMPFKNPMKFNQRWVVVTGASSGLGEEMARQLAGQHQANLILVARRAGRLEALKSELEKAHGVQCHVIAADLSKPADVDRVYTESLAVCEPYAIILNAGITHFGRHLDLDWADFEAMLATNVTSVVRLINLFSPFLIKQNQGGGLLLVSSMAGLLPLPYQAAYAGTKAFITNFAQSFSQELRDENISLTVFSPGGIDTAMTRNSKLKYFENTVFLQDAASCASDGIDALRTRKTLFVPGLLNRTQLFATRFAPRSLIALITQKTYSKALSES